MSRQTELNGTTPQPYVRANNEATARNVSTSTTLYGGRTAALKLDIIIVGCGLGGLAAAHCLGKAGHRIRVLEQAPQIGEVGAGIQVTPNVSRLLLRWGLGPALAKTAVKPQAIVFRRYSTGERIGYTDWSTMYEDYGAPYYHIHRADYHRLLFDLAAPYMDLQLDSCVASIYVPSPSYKDPSPRPEITLSNGKKMSCDLLIGADGVKSLIRNYVVGRADAPTPTGDAAYRACIPASLILAEPSLRSLVESPEMTGWMAPKRHIMGYCIRAKQEYNMVLLHPDDGSVESWTAQGSAEKMVKDFDDFEPRIQKLLSFIPTTLKWKLMDREPLETWIDSTKRVVLMGDACHPMLPYRAQGAAMAVEDAAVLGTIFSHLTHKSQIGPFLDAYFGLRYTRTRDTQLSSRLNQKIFHLEDGPEQERRDEEMRSAMRGEGDWEGNSNQWADRKKNAEQFGYDANEEAERWWREKGKYTVPVEEVQSKL